MSLIIADGDMLAYKACAATQSETNLGTLDDPRWCICSDRPRAREEFDNSIHDLAAAVGLTSDEVVLCFTANSQWRRDLWPEYKISRKEVAWRTPVGLKDFKQELLGRENTFMYEQIEADDLMGLFATMDDRDMIIASGDKDLLQIPGKHLWIKPSTINSYETLFKQEEPGRTIEDLENGYVLQTTTEEWSDEFFYVQCITGDTADDIPGACAGVGPVKAKAALRKAQKEGTLDHWEVVIQQFEKGARFPDARAAAIRNARLVRILRTGEYDFETHEVFPWNPPIKSQPSVCLPSG